VILSGLCIFPGHSLCRPDFAPGNHPRTGRESRRQFSCAVRTCESESSCLNHGVVLGLISQNETRTIIRSQASKGTHLERAPPLCPHTMSVRISAARACDRCRRSKRKCLPASPHAGVNADSSGNGQSRQYCGPLLLSCSPTACAVCAATGDACTFVLENRPRGPSKAYVQRLESHVKALEETVRSVRLIRPYWQICCKLTVAARPVYRPIDTSSRSDRDCSFPAGRSGPRGLRTMR
jgi:hypothetical protein